jgi:hypothetical protein
VPEEAVDLTSEIGGAYHDGGAEKDVQSESIFVLLTTMDLFDRCSNIVSDNSNTLRVFEEKSISDNIGETGFVYGDFAIK